MAVRLAADLRLSADGSAFRGPHISGGRPSAGSQRAYILDSSATQPAFCSLGWDRQTEGSLNAPLRRGHNKGKQEAQLSPSDRAMRLVSSNLANCHATVQKLLIRQVLTKLMV